MLPISLKISGIYSYQEEQVIDFAALTSAGLFGIFGAVGSGKSTILEAITLSLYGQIERLNTKGRSYNLLNLKSNKAYIEFEFRYEEVQYKFVATWRRNSKNFLDVNTIDRKAYKFSNETWEPISNDAQLILGLSYDHFKRTIIIPQGKFKEFLELGAQERTTMVKEIFDLHRFDLKDKTTRLYNETEKEKIGIEGNLKAYETINPEDKTLLETEIDALTQLQADATNLLQTEQNVLKQYDALAEKCKHLADIQTKAQQLHIQAPAYEQRKEQLAIYLQTFELFKSKMDAYHKSKQEKQQFELQQTQIQQELEVLGQTQKTLAAEELILLPKITALDHQRKEIEDWKTIAELVENQRKIQHLSERKTAGNQHILDTKTKLRLTLSELQNLQETLASLEQNPLNVSSIQQLSEWYQTQANLKAQIDTNRKTYTEKAEKVTALHTQIEALGATVQHYQTQYTHQEQVVELQLENNSQVLQNLHLQKELQQYADALEEGCACPLCGATEHPHKLESQNIAEAFALAQAERTSLQETLKQHKQVYDRVKGLHQEIVFIQQQTEALQTEFQTFEQALQQHLALFNFAHYDANNSAQFDADKQQFIQEEQQKAELRKQIEAQQKALDTLQLAERKFEEAIKEFDMQIIAFKATNQTLFTKIQVLNADYYLKSSEPIAFTAKIQETEAIIAATVQAQELWQKAQQNVALELSNKKGNLTSIQEYICKKQIEIQSLEAQLEQALQAQKLDNLQTVTAILAQNINIASEQNELQLFFQNLHQVQENKKRLQAEIGTQTYDAEQHQHLQNQVQALQKVYESGLEQLSTLKEQLQSLMQRLQEQQTLQAAHLKVATRWQHLATLKRLFTGDKFVEYISATYLRQLCAIANERFHRLTRNQLSLSINADNDFEIIDYLNGGKPRSVKTLSGGQGFQASLSLALALAESVQAKSKQKEQFFFIDEGFGTQDKATINIVFETLQDLRNDHRIVGIISHVEELQEQIVKYLTIEKDEEKGSIIHPF